MNKHWKYKIKAHQEICENFEKDVKTFVQDKSLPLKQRWEVFVLTKVGKRSGWIEDFPALKVVVGKDDISWYDEFYIDRHQTVVMTEFVESLYENQKYAGYKKKDIEAFQEEILEKFIWSFEFDW